MPEDTTIRRYAFDGCRSLAIQSPSGDNRMIIVNHILFYPVDILGCLDVVIPDTVRMIGDEAFCGQSYITTVTFPKETPKIGIKDECNAKVFRFCKSLADENGFVIINNCLYDYFGEKEDISIPEGVTAISGIFQYKDEGVFKNATTVRVPKSVEHFGEQCFYRVKNVIFEGTPPYKQSNLWLTGIIKGCLFGEAANKNNQIVGKGATIIAPEAIYIYYGKVKSIVIAKGVKTIVAPLIKPSLETGVSDFYIPDSVELITGPIVQNKTNRTIVIHAYLGSYGELYAAEHGYEFKPITGRSKINWE